MLYNIIDKNADLWSCVLPIDKVESGRIMNFTKGREAIKNTISMNDLSHDVLLRIGRNYAKMGSKNLSEELNIPRRTISAVVARMRTLGVIIPKINKTRSEALNSAVEVLKKENIRKGWL
mgnify:CR=1 FL=1